MSDHVMLRALAMLSFLAVWGVAAVSLVMGRWLLRRRGEELTWPAVVAVVLATLGCYPLIKGYSLGNAQTFLSFGFTVLLLLWTTGQERWAGVVAAMLTAVKPQFVLLLVWMLVRKKWGAAWAFLACGAVLLAMSIAVFGWHNNLDYIGVLAGLSHKAQSHYANQSMFGTINRMIFNGENIEYTPYVYTPFIAWVYRVTVMTSLVLVGVCWCIRGESCAGRRRTLRRWGSRRWRLARWRGSITTGSWWGSRRGRGLRMPAGCRSGRGCWVLLCFCG